MTFNRASLPSFSSEGEVGGSNKQRCFVANLRRLGGPPLPLPLSLPKMSDDGHFLPQLRSHSLISIGRCALSLGPSLSRSAKRAVGWAARARGLRGWSSPSQLVKERGRYTKQGPFRPFLWTTCVMASCVGYVGYEQTRCCP